MESSQYAGVPNRQVLLLLAILAVPCALVCGLGLQLFLQERDLEFRRIQEDRRREVARLEAELLAELERIKLQVLSDGRHDAVPLVVAIRDGTIILEAEDNERFRTSLQSSKFGAYIRRAEHEEFATRRLNQAEKLYRIAPAQGPAERAYSNLLLARTLKKAGRTAEANQVIDALLRTPVNYRDEFGIPFALYAASAHSAQDAALRGLSMNFPTFGSAALFKARELAVVTGAKELLPDIDRWIGYRRKAEAMRAEFSRLAGRLDGDENIWLAWGTPMWLLSVMPNHRALIAVDPACVKLPVSFSRNGEALSARFPGLRIEVPEVANRRTAGMRFQFLALAVVIGLTMLAGVLLWRDVGRNIRFAELQAEFVASVSHELRTPLTSIRMFAELLRINDDMEPEARAGHLNTILQESERLSRLVEHVLHFSRLEKGRQTYQRKRQSLEDVVESAARAFGAYASQTGFVFAVECDAGLPEVEVDGDAIVQAILNLLSNAVKYSGVSREIVLRVRRQGSDAVIQVIDHGIGIAAEDQRRIFDRFYRVASDVNRQVSGTGLGLTLVRHIVEAHGGSVCVDSRPGSGSTFSIFLPFSQEAA